MAVSSQNATRPRRVRGRSRHSVDRKTSFELQNSRQLLPYRDYGRVARQPPISRHEATFDLSAEYKPILIQLIGQLAACPRIHSPAVFFLRLQPLFPKRLAWQTPVDSAVASCGYYRQRATGHHRPAAREHSHLVRLRQRALHLLSACISGSQALMKGGRNDHI